MGKPESVIRFRFGLVSFFAFGAGVTILTHIAQVFTIPFAAYATTALVTAAAALIIGLAGCSRSVSADVVHDTSVVRLVLVLAVIGAILALAINRPDPDDFYYVPNAVYHLQHPADPMNFDIHYLAFDGAPPTSALWGTSGPYEYAQAALARFLKLDFLSVYYLISPALIGFMIPIAFFLATCCFTDSTRNAARGVLVFTCVALLLGETHWAFGNISFARAFQGKIILFSIGIPSFVSFSFDYFEKPTISSWFVLFCISTSMVGVSTSSSWLLPALALVLGLSFVITSRNRLQTISMLPRYFGTLLYGILFVAMNFRLAAGALGIGSVLNAGWPTTFRGYAGLLVNFGVPLTPLISCVSLIVSLMLLSQERRNFVASWTALTGVIFVNPVVAPLLIRFVSNAYWRFFYISPFPLVISIAAASLLDTKSPRLADRRGLIPKATLATLLALVLFLPRGSVLSEASVDVGLPAYKLPEGPLDTAKKALTMLAPGPMLAPGELAGISVMLDSRYPALRIREDGVRLWLSEAGRLNDAELRIKASDYLDGRGGDLQALGSVISLHPELRSVIIRADIYDNSKVKLLLSDHGFEPRGVANYYAVLER